MFSPEIASIRPNNTGQVSSDTNGQLSDVPGQENSSGAPQTTTTAAAAAAAAAAGSSAKRCPLMKHLGGLVGASGLGAALGVLSVVVLGTSSSVLTLTTAAIFGAVLGACIFEMHAAGFALGEHKKWDEGKIYYICSLFRTVGFFGGSAAAMAAANAAGGALIYTSALSVAGTMFGFSIVVFITYACLTTFHSVNDKAIKQVMRDHAALRQVEDNQEKLSHIRGLEPSKEEIEAEVNGKLSTEGEIAGRAQGLATTPLVQGVKDTDTSMIRFPDQQELFHYLS